MNHYMLKYYLLFIHFRNICHIICTKMTRACVHSQRMCWILMTLSLICGLLKIYISSLWDLRTKPYSKLRISIPLCHLFLLPLLRPILEVDVQLLENEFINGYREGDKVLYVSHFIKMETLWKLRHRLLGEHCLKMTRTLKISLGVQILDQIRSIGMMKSKDFKDPPHCWSIRKSLQKDGKGAW